MKKLLTLIVSAAFAAAAHADLTITQKVESDNASTPGGNMALTMKFKGEKVRMDVGDKASTIMDVKSGDMQTLMHEQKVTMAIPGAMLKKMQEQAAKANTDTKVEPPKPTGKKETINGFSCEEYETSINGSKVQIWVTKDLPAAEKAMKDLTALSAQSNPMGSMMKDQTLPGFPMKSVIEMPGGGKTTVTVTALSEQPVDDGAFKVPSDYKPMQMPSAPGAGASGG